MGSPRERRQRAVGKPYQGLSLFLPICRHGIYEPQRGEPSICVPATGIAKTALGAISGQLPGAFALLSCKAAFHRLSIPWRLGLLVLALALPLNLIILGAIWGLVSRAEDAQRTSLLY